MKSFVIRNGFHVEPPAECATKMSDANGREPYPGFAAKFAASQAAAAQTITRMSENVDPEMARKIEEHRRAIADASNANALQAIVAEAKRNAPPGSRPPAPKMMSEQDEYNGLLEQLAAFKFDTKCLPADADAELLRAILASIQDAMNPPAQQPQPRPGAENQFMERRPAGSLSTERRRELLSGSEAGRRILAEEKRSAKAVSTFSEKPRLSERTIRALSGTSAGTARLRKLGITPRVG